MTAHGVTGTTRTGRATSYALVLAYAATIVVPVYYVLVSAFKDNTAISLHPLAPPTSFTLRPFREALDRVQLGAAIGNSALVAIAGVVLTLVVSVPAAYGLARHAGWFGKAATAAFGVAFLIPQFAVLVPVYLGAVKTGLIAAPLLYLVLFYSAISVPAAVLLLVPFFRAVPKELDETAELDGAGVLAKLWYVLVPIVRPGMATVAVLVFLSIWNDYIFAQVITDPSSYTAQVTLPLLQSEGAYQGAGVDFSVVAAGVVLSCIPVFVAYAVLRRRLIDSFAAGAVKG